MSDLPTLRTKVRTRPILRRVHVRFTTADDDLEETPCSNVPQIRNYTTTNHLELACLLPRPISPDRQAHIFADVSRFHHFLIPHCRGQVDIKWLQNLLHKLLIRTSDVFKADDRKFTLQ